MFIQVTIKAEEKQQEEVIAMLSDYNPIGFEQTELELIAYFDKDDYDSAVIEVIKNYIYEIRSIEEQNWNMIWESNFQPVKVDEFCAVRAHFHKPITDLQHEIIITPKMSFGTGHHATTFMMLQQMKALDFTGKVVLDFGTGTGILSILAEKCGAASIIAIDVDDWSIKNALENITINNCCKINLSLTSKIPEQQFDIVLANINRNVILQYLPQIKRVVKKEGLLLLSGLLTIDETDIVNACFDIEMVLKKKIERENWISLLLFKR